VKSSDEALFFSEQVVEEVICVFRPDIGKKWRGIQPQSLGISSEDWLDISEHIIKIFNSLAGMAVRMLAPSRATYLDRSLGTFAVAIADLADSAP
jgi:hypothetical protein